jgi:hypothetical protein
MDLRTPSADEGAPSTDVADASVSHPAASSTPSGHDASIPPAAGKSSSTSGGLTEDQKLAVISDHIVRAATIEAAVSVDARVDENSIWQHITVAFSVVLLIVIINYIVAVAMLPQRFPKMFCWKSNVYNRLKSVCSPTIVDGSYEYGAWAVSLAATYPPLFSFMELFGVPNLPPQAAQFLAKCIALHGNLITPYMWCGNQTQNCQSDQLKQWSLNHHTNVTIFDGWVDILPYCPTAVVTQNLEDVVCYQQHVQGDGNMFITYYSLWLTSCSCGNSFAVFFPSGTDSTSLFEQALTIPSIQECIRIEPGRARQTHTMLGRLYDGGLVAVAQALALMYHDADDMYRHMFTGNADFLTRSAEDCNSAAFQSGLQTGVNTASGAAGFALMAPALRGWGGGLLKTGIALAGVTAGVFTGIAAGNTTKDQCTKDLTGTVPRRCCTGINDICIRTKFPSEDDPTDFVENTRSKCKIGLPVGGDSALCCYFDVPTAQCQKSDPGCTS